MDPAVRLDNLSNLTVGRLAGLQHSSVIIKKLPDVKLEQSGMN